MICVSLSACKPQTGQKVIKHFSCYGEHEILTAHKKLQILNSKGFFLLKTVRRCIYSARIKNKFHAQVKKLGQVFS